MVYNWADGWHYAVAESQFFQGEAAMEREKVDKFKMGTDKSWLVGEIVGWIVGRTEERKQKGKALGLWAGKEELGCPYQVLEGHLLVFYIIGLTQYKWDFHW